MKRVVIDASSCMIGPWNQHLSGIGRTTLELIRALEAQNNLPFELALFCQRWSRERLQRYNFTSKQFCLSLPRFPSVEKIKRLFPVVETLTGSDIYHIPHNHSGFCRNAQTILTIHDAMIFEIREDHLYSPSERLVLKRDAERCAAIITCSTSSKRLLLKYLDVQEEKITVAPWGYNAVQFHPLEKNIVQEKLEQRFRLTKPYLFSVSCDIGRKRTPELVRQYLKFAKDGYPYDLVLVWSHVSNEINELIANNPMKHRIHIIPAVSDEELTWLYNGSVCLVFPSTHEGFGLPVLEAMACGTPVLTTYVTSMPEIAGNAAIYLDSLAEDEIGTKLQQLANKCFDLKALSEKSIARAKNFSWTACADTTISVYQKVLS